ncbi:MAG: sensor histidine kinase [Alphaproteobacteria bacterium]|nr:sensor histidine kinase [Alphaproteobacteria bacterium]
MRVLSLRSRLALIILVPLILISIIAGYWRFTVALQTAEDLFDRTLLASSLAIARDIDISAGDALSEITRDLLRDTSGGQIFYHVNGPDGVYVTGYATPPVAPGAATQPVGQPIYFQSQHLGQDVRVVRLREASNFEGLSGFSMVTVWQTFDGRDQFVRDLALRAILLIASLVLTVAVVVWLGINFGLRPLTDLQGAISSRSSDDLGQIKRPLPKEVRGIVSTLNTLFDQLEQSIHSKDVFISDAAHQLRNPIAGVLSMAEAVRSARTADDTAERTDELIDAARHASRLANQLLSYERARAGSDSGRGTTFDLVEITNEVATRNAERIAACGLDLQMDLSETPIFLQGEPVLVAEAIENLIDNALRHAGPGLSRIRIHVAQHEFDAEISVADDGRGISPEDQSRAFDRFRQLEPSAGSGLGLSIVETIAKNFGGTVSIESVEVGACIVIRFPISAAKQPYPGVRVGGSC